jgi:hypothetical protein
MNADIENNVRRIFQIKKEVNVSKEHLKYYYLNKYEYCCDIGLKPLFDNIKKFDYSEPTKKLSEYYKGSDPNYFKELYSKVKNTKWSAPVFWDDFSLLVDGMMLNYIQCFPNMSLMVLWPTCDISKHIKQTNFYKKLEENGTIHGGKKITMSRKQIQGLIFQLYYDKSGFKNFFRIKKKQLNSNANERLNTVHFLFYECNKPEIISGKDATFKTELREILKKESGKSDDFPANFFLHVTDTFAQTVEISKLICNRNSMRFLNYQRLDRLLCGGFHRSLAIFMTFKKWLYSTFHPLDHTRFLTFSSILLYLLGAREMNDLDVLIHHLPDPNKSKTKDFMKHVKFYLEDEKTKFPFIDYSMKGKQGWCKGGEKEYLCTWFESEWPQKFQARSLQEAILNPRFHLYYFGIKIISLNADISRRLSRGRAAAYADLIALKDIYEIKIKIPNVPSGYWVNHVYKKMSDSEIEVLRSKIKWYLYKRYKMKKSISDINKIIKKE